MNCSSLTLHGLNNACKESSFGGIKEIYAIPYEKITYKINNSTHTLVPILLGNLANVAHYEFGKYNVCSMTTNYDSETKLYTTELSISLNKLDSAKREVFMGLALTPCVMLVRDANNTLYYLGLENYVDSASGEATTGAALTENSQYTLTFTDNGSFELPYTILEDDFYEFITPNNKKYLTFELLDGYYNPVDISWFWEGAGIGTNIEVSYDKVNWENIAAQQHYLQYGQERMYVRGVNTTIDSDEHFAINSSLGSDSRIKIYGNLMSLIYGDDFIGKYTMYDNTKFVKLFTNSNAIADASGLIMSIQELKPYCYQEMFSNCVNLVKAPELPSQSLAEHCYQNMFAGCTSLTKAPQLPARNLQPSCYSNMFDGCESLNYVYCMANYTNQNLETSYWLNDVAATGTFVKRSGVTWDSGIDGIPDGWTIEEK